jgi:serine/threonine protein phosphatase PrpC
VAGLDEQTRSLRSGATLSIVCVLESHHRAAVAALGDSPVVAVDRSGRVSESPDHNVRSNLEERKRAEERGGVYTGGYIVNSFSGEGLQIARALGDSGLEGIVSREPAVYTIEIGPQSVIVLASDGLFDPSHGESDRLIREMLALRESLPTFDAQALIAWAQRRGLADNATAVVWKAFAGD